MARAKSPITLPVFPASTPHKIGSGDVFERDGTRLIVTEAPKGAPQIECRDVKTGKLKTMLKHVLEEKFAKLGTLEAGKCARALIKTLKAGNKSNTPSDVATKSRKPRAKKNATAASAASSNQPGAGPNPFMN